MLQITAADFQLLQIVSIFDDEKMHLEFKSFKINMLWLGTDSAQGGHNLWENGELFMKIMKMLESVATAAAFAEAGERDTALQLMKMDETKKKIIVAYHGEPAERQVIQAALPVAARLRCELLFACVLGSQQAAKLGKNFLESANRSFKQIFSEEVAKLPSVSEQISARQIVVFESFNEAVRKICDETREVEFVLLRCEECKLAQLHIDVPYFFMTSA